ncbi:MAG: HNH endonuclease [Blastocatellia bacterium]
MPRIHVPTELRRLVIERALGCCEYCLIHQDYTDFSHQVDHIIAIKHRGLTVLINLALACLECNLLKGSDLTSIDPLTGEIIPLFNPRWQNWREHFTFQAEMIVGLTPTGRTTTSLLQFNRSDRAGQRRYLIKLGVYPPQSIV